MNFISIDSVFFEYDNGYEALKNINMEFNLGEKVAIIGQNGAGKTTLLKLINGLNKPSKGNIIINKVNIKDKTTAEVSKDVSYVFQNPDDQIFNNDVYSEIAFGPKKNGVKGNSLKKIVYEAAELCGLTDDLKKNPYDLPYATRKFVSIASVLVMQSNVFLLDEPTAGQDKIGIEKLQKIIDYLIKKNKIVITITHDMEFVVNNFDRIIVMANGQKIIDSNKKEIFWDEEILNVARLKQPYISSLAKDLGVPGQPITIKEFIKQKSSDLYA
ncbi:ABC transporter ATP-binding protein [Companilactobacillus sp. RD055328]|uniref:energy-coupling factor ABC transporter ATP-binding protein n=1 Tax=Companilactobacillus sp. RD055328 TaxID=2916634 RepID=UPI001FC816E4|nr:ABC transporter ATP-binding protein [Companilactobacillus sp. RD055328]GKQ43440.1 ABC transporter ATP-binding protein [Companilactobacillus sp. RD055328]